MPGRTKSFSPLARASRGFTFLEILVALAILGATFTVLLQAHAAALRQQASARRLMTATLLAREILTDTEVSAALEIGADEGDFGEDFPNYTWIREVESLSLPFVSTGSLPTDYLRMVRIVVSWPDRGETQSTELVYYALKP